MLQNINKVWQRTTMLYYSFDPTQSNSIRSEFVFKFFLSRVRFAFHLLQIISSIYFRFRTWNVSVKCVFPLLKAERKAVQTSFTESVSTFELSEDRTGRSQLSKSKTIACQTHITPSDYTSAICHHCTSKWTERNEMKPSQKWFALMEFYFDVNI